MARKKLPPPAPLAKKNEEPIEHKEARLAFVESLVTSAVVSGFSFRAIVEQVMSEGAKKGYHLKRDELVEVVRRAEETMRSELAHFSEKQRNLTAHQLVTIRDRAFRQVMQTNDLPAMARFMARHVDTSERLGKFFGWDEPERMHIQVSGPSDRVVKVMEGFDDAAFTKLAAEELEKERTIQIARRLAGLPSGHLKVVSEDE